MHKILTALSSYFDWFYVPHITITDILEIIILSYLLYHLMLWFKKTRAWTLLKGVVVLVAFMANKYFSQGLFAPVDATFAATIEAGAGGDVAKWLIIWAIPGAIIQFLGGSRQVGILFATGLLVGSTINGLTILIALLIRFVLVRRNKENEHTLNILGAGSLAGAALYSFFTATLALGKKK